MGVGLLSNYNSVSKIIIIGAGELGSRHLQGLTKISDKISITVLDPSPLALKKAEKRYNEIPKSKFIKKIEFINSMNLIKSSVDLAIFSTNADIRFTVIQNFLSKYSAKYIIIEKIAFQSIKDFEKISSILNEKNIKAWVNCPRRTFPFFAKLKERTIKSSKVHLSVEGSKWGLACNSIHFLDTLAFLSDQTDFFISDSNYEKKIFNSKRNGFLELSGMLTVKSKRGDILNIIDNRSGQIPFKISIHFDDIIVEIDQNNGIVKEFHKSEINDYTKEDYPLFLQSDLTGIQVEQIIKNSFSELTSFKESYKLHVPLIESFNQHFSSVMNKNITVCPIT